MPQFIHALVAIAFVCWTGVPLAVWLFRNGEKKRSHLLLHSFISGLLTIGLVSQLCWKSGWNAHQATWPFLGLVSVINLLLLFTVVQIHRADLSNTENSGLATVGLVSLLLLSVYAVNGGKPYYGRAWGDQINYSLVANFLQSASPDSKNIPYTKPAEQVAVRSGLLDDRIGQSTLHAWISELSGSLALESFYFTCVIGVLAFCISLYLIARALGVSDRLAALTAAIAGVAPPLHAIHLESFLSQIVVTPVIFYTVLVSFNYTFSGRRCWLVLSLLGFVWVLTAYFEFFPILLAAETSLCALLIWFTPAKWRGALLLGSTLLVALALACWLSANPLKLMMRGGVIHPGFEKFFPWAYKPEGLARLLVGDWAPLFPPYVILGLAAIVAGMTAWSILNLSFFAYCRRHPLALSLATLLLLPLGVSVLPGDHSYQFYKLLQSVWPVTLIAIVPFSLGQRFSSNRGRAMMGTIGLCCTLLVLGASSFHMLATEAIGRSARSGLSPYLQENGEEAINSLVGSQTGKRVIINMPSRRNWNDLLVNGVLSLQLSHHFEKIQAKWVHIGEHQHQQPVSDIVPADPAIPDIRSIQSEFRDNLSDTLVLQAGSTFLKPASCLMEQIGTSGRLQLFRPVSNQWLIASTVVGPEPRAFTEDDQGMIIGGRPELFMRLDLESAAELPAGTGIEIEYEAAPELGSMRWHIYSNTGYGTFVYSDRDVLRMNSGSLRLGVTELYFGPSPETDTTQPVETVRVKITSIRYGL